MIDGKKEFNKMSEELKKEWVESFEKMEKYHGWIHEHKERIKSFSQMLEEFKREFGIHFSPSELQFAEGFIKESFEDILESMPLEKKDYKKESIYEYDRVTGYNKAVKEVKEWREKVMK